MPLHLDSLSRRRFLHGSAILLLSRHSRSDAVPDDSETWALLSDTHIAGDRNFEARGINMADQLNRVVAEVVAEKDDLSGVIIDGDCAYNDGQKEDYIVLLDLLKPLRDAGLPIHFTLGNHDDRDNFYDCLAHASDGPPVRGKHCSVIETPVANLILLDSLRFVNQVEGEFGEEQLAWLAAYLDSHPDKPAISIGHHYLQGFREDTIPKDKPVRITGLIDSDAFLETIDTRTAAKAYVYGHSHTWNTMHDKNGVHRINLPPTSYVFNEKHPSGWVRAVFSPSGVDLEMRALDSDHPQHGEKRSLPWR